MIVFERPPNDFGDPPTSFAVNPIHIVLIEPSDRGCFIFDSAGERRETSQSFKNVVDMLTNIFEGAEVL